VSLAFASTFVLPASDTSAHGGPPSALGIVAADERGQPSLVLLNEGLALERDDRWWFMCPRMWGEADTSAGKAPLARSVDGVLSWIIGKDDLYSLRDGSLVAHARADLSAASVIALAEDDGALLGLSLGSTGSAIVRIDDAASAPLFTSPESWSWFATGDGNLHLARWTTTGEVVRLVVDRAGEVIEEFRTPLAIAPAQLRLRPTARGLFAVTFDGAQYALVAIEQASWQVLLQSPGPIDGPQASASGELWVALDGELMRDGGGEFAVVGEARRVTCLEQWGAHSYACIGSDLYSLGDAGLDERLFQLDHLSAPDPALVPADGERECRFQWLLYRNDLERTGLSPEGDADEDAGADEPGDAAVAPPPGPDAGAGEPEKRSGCDCSAAGASARGTPHWAWFAAGLGSFVRLTRSRRAPCRGTRSRTCPSTRCPDCRWPDARPPDPTTARRTRTGR
jgi:hypothetical protein